MRLELQERNLDELSEAISKLDNDDVVKSHMAKYFCVLVSGYVENFVKDLVSNYHQNTCKKETARFVNAKLRNITNLDDGKIVAFLQSFSDDWVAQYLEVRTDEMESAFNTVYAQRNKIAHGDSSNSNVTPKMIFGYYEVIKDALALLSMIIVKR